MSEFNVGIELKRKPEAVAPVYPEEVQALAGSLTVLDAYDNDPLRWSQETGVFKPGNVLVAELSPTLRCTESCPGCPDSLTLLMERIEADEGKPDDDPTKIQRQEVKAEVRDMQARVVELKRLGVRHVMNIGGTIDRVKSLPELINTELNEGLVVSWFTDGIPQIEEDGRPTALLTENLASEWLPQVATHVSTDYPFGYKGTATGDLLSGDFKLPPKRKRQDQFVDDPEYSRVFKSQYGPAMMKALIEKGVRRVVANMTISSRNADQIEAVYNQAVELQEYAASIGSPTEVLFSFSPWVWRPHQARGDNPKDNSPEDALSYADMPMVNSALSGILDDTYRRVADGRPRILANSSGYTSLHADRAFWREAVEQDVAYPLGKPLALNVLPTADLTLDPMFKGPELAVVKSTFGYMDRTYDPAQNPFSDFHHNNRPYLPNIIALESRDDPEAQPVKIMDRRLARMIVNRQVIQFFRTEDNLRNKSDSPHSLGNPRRLGSDPYDALYIAERILQVAQTECDGDLLMGLATYGLGLAAVASALSAKTDKPMRFNYVKLTDEAWKGKDVVEGDINLEDTPILIDDLLFHGKTKRLAVERVIKRGFKPIVDIIFVIDRMLQHEGWGPSLEQDGFRTHSLITMDQIVQYMVEHGAITPAQLQDLVEDYRMHPRHYLPAFARP